MLQFHFFHARDVFSIGGEGKINRRWDKNFLFFSRIRIQKLYFRENRKTSSSSSIFFFDHLPCIAFHIPSSHLNAKIFHESRSEKKKKKDKEPNPNVRTVKESRNFSPSKKELHSTSKSARATRENYVQVKRHQTSPKTRSL